MACHPPSTPSTCPRCGGAFLCGVGDPMPCACGSVALGAPLLAELRERYTACLCLPCLELLARQQGHGQHGSANEKAGAPVGTPALH